MIDPRNMFGDEPDYPDDAEPTEGRTHVLTLVNIPDEARIVTTEVVHGTTVHVVTSVYNAIPLDEQPFGAGVDEKLNVEAPYRADFRSRLN